MGQGGTDWLSGYDSGGHYCELFGCAGQPAAHTEPVRERLRRIPIEDLRRRAREAENELFNLGYELGKAGYDWKKTPPGLDWTVSPEPAPQS